MRHITNTQDHYGMIAILFHWVMALLLVVMLALGLYMTRISMSLFKLKLFGWHKEYGVLVLMLVILRLVWRLLNIKPTLPPEIPRWQKVSARVVHWLFYFLMFALPISGWLISSAAGLPVSFFGLFVLPDFISASETARHLFSEIHEWLAYALILILCLHASAALKHHFIDKNDILRKML